IALVRAMGDADRLAMGGAAGRCAGFGPARPDAEREALAKVRRRTLEVVDEPGRSGCLLVRAIVVGVEAVTVCARAQLRAEGDEVPLARVTLARTGVPRERGRHRQPGVIGAARLESIEAGT